MLRSFRRGSVPLLVVAAVLVGFLVGFSLPAIRHGPELLCNVQTTVSEDADKHSAQSPPLTPPDEQRCIQDMVSKTNGFYARDYSLWLDWNDMRNIIETAVLHGQILNRTTIIPSFVYARTCEFDIQTCAAYTTMVNRSDATHTNQWSELPLEQQIAWRIPIDVMLNLTHFQQSHSVIRTEDYLRLHNMSIDIETSHGQWDTETYHVRDSSGGVNPSIHVVHNDWYDSGIMIRADLIPQDMRFRGGWTQQIGGNPSRDEVGRWTRPKSHSAIYRALVEAMPLEKPMIEWDIVQRVLKEEKHITSTSSTEEITNVLRENGFEVVYSFGVPGPVFAREVTTPTYHAVPRHRLRGFYEDFRGIKERVLLIQGELHMGRKPGALYFSSIQSRDRFARTVLYDMRLTDNILSLAKQISDRMFDLNGGRHWMAAHMPRGDFLKLDLVEADFAEHLARIKYRLEEGRKTLESIHAGETIMYDVPDARPDPLLVTLAPPKMGDKYYIATDERDPEKLGYLREQGAVLINDLLTEKDHQAIGWPILLTDVLALLEQSILSHAGYFYAHPSSSVAGEVMNLRAGLGMDPRTALLD